MSEIIARVPDAALARALIAALRGYGFHPLEPFDDGLPGITDPIFGKGIPIRVPDDEAEDAKLLAEDLLREMRAGK
jgi:hypothetical protein